MFMQNQVNYSYRIHRHLILQTLFFVFLLAIDQGTKYLAASFLKDQADVPLISDAFVLHYLENTGAAFGIFRGQVWLFYVLTSVILVVLIFFFIRIHGKLLSYPDVAGQDYREKTVRSMTFLNGTIAALAAGACGNLIDRIVHGYVIDFVDVRLIRFPVFNFADICVTVSCIFIVIFFLFLYKEDDHFRIFSSSKPNLH